MKNIACFTLMLGGVLLVPGINHARAAETNALPTGALPPTEFQLTSQPPAVEKGRSAPLPPAIVQSNNARLLQRRAAILKDLGSRSNGNGAVVVFHSNRVGQLKARIEELQRKKADGTITAREQRQLEQLELLAARTATNRPPASATVPPPAAPAEQKAP